MISGSSPPLALALASRLLLTGTEVLPAVPLLLRRSAAEPSLDSRGLSGLHPQSAELDRLPRWAPFVVMAVLTLLAFRQYLLSGSGEMLLGQDTIAAGIMFRKFFVEHIRALGRMPLWNPYLFGGVPTVEAGSGDILYPASVLHFLLPLTSALAWKLILHVYLAGVFMYLAARALGTRRYIALFAGSAYLLSANLVSLVWGGQDGKMYVIALFPAALWLLVTALDSALLAPLSLARRSGRPHGSGSPPAGVLRLHRAGGICTGQPLGSPAGGWSCSRQQSCRRYARGGDCAGRSGRGASADVPLSPGGFSPRRTGPRLRVFRQLVAARRGGALLLYTGVLRNRRSVGDVLGERTRSSTTPSTEARWCFVLGIAALFGLRGDPRRGPRRMAAVALLYALGAGTPVFRLLYVSSCPGSRTFERRAWRHSSRSRRSTLLATLFDSIGCWPSRRPARPERHATIALLAGAVARAR